MESCVSLGGFAQASGTNCSQAECPNIQEANWTVDDDFIDQPDADFNSIQSAIDAASDGDVIIVYPGVYAESTQDWCLRIDNLDVKILAVGDRLVTVDGQTERGFLHCEGDVPASTLIRGVQFTNASLALPMMSFAGNDPNPTIQNCSFENLACRGILLSAPENCCNGGEATFDSCVFSSIDIVDQVYGIYANYSSLNFQDCVLRHHSDRPSCLRITEVPKLHSRVVRLMD